MTHPAAWPPAGKGLELTRIAGALRESAGVDLVEAENLEPERGETECAEAERATAERAKAERGEMERAEAERLISDLAALVEAGLVVVEPRVLGPARYAVGPDLEDAA